MWDLLTKHDFRDASRSRRWNNTMSTPRHASTPIRRISRGSLSAGTGRSQDKTPLSFLQAEALPILAEESGALQDNLERLSHIQNALSTFNESFGMFLYGLKMNAFCVEWPEAPTEEHLQRYEARKCAWHCGGAD